MITTPSIAQLLTSMQAELIDKIKPGLTDPTLVVNVDMMTAVLGALAVRVEHELAWMREEADRIEAAADAVLIAQPRSAPLVAALAEYRERRTSSLLLSEAQADYDRAGEVLSQITEVAFASGDPALVRLVEQLFEQRLATEQTAIGTFVAAGR
jgi:hypothetical protein